MTSHLIQILLPLKDNDGAPYDSEIYRAIHGELVQAFGGLTAFTRAPATGTWLDGSHKEIEDVIVVEVMAESLDAPWWAAFRQRLEALMRQKQIVVRAHPIARL